MKIFLASGDHPSVIRAIANELDLSSDITPNDDEEEEDDDQERGEKVINGADFNAMSDDDLSEALKHTRAFARLSPAQKLRLVEALQRRGEIVLVTGDGTSDAPALKRADTGISMGISGSDVAKEASDMILLNDNFATIITAAEFCRTDSGGKCCLQ
eukprot:TRINITY_DN17731_c0_g1_i1.p1 TRINITY_DN17731_c0_g1~~TRINITY_DN17731_c0_g1_i1.p1  ORF type:complete len:172 (-),score=48.88 TRINITY_DN17731_c0_g1_i1:4-474(-)